MGRWRNGRKGTQEEREEGRRAKPGGDGGGSEKQRLSFGSTSSLGTRGELELRGSPAPRWDGDSRISLRPGLNPQTLGAAAFWLHVWSEVTTFTL